MKLDELRALVDKMAPQVEDTFRQDKTHAPIAFVFYPDDVDITLMMLDRPRERRAVFEAACHKGAHAVVFITEAWLVMAKPGVDHEAVEDWAGRRSLAEWPGRIEAVVINAACPEGEVMRSWRIEREKGRPHLVRMDSDPVMAGGIMYQLPWQA